MGSIAFAVHGDWVLALVGVAFGSGTQGVFVLVDRDMAHEEAKERTHRLARREEIRKQVVGEMRPPQQVVGEMRPPHE